MELTADCDRCCGLCCVAPSFPASEDFAYTKAAHTPCVHLETANTCRIHQRLEEQGFRGCRVYECWGAGQKVTQKTFAGKSWTELEDPRRMFEAFMTMRVLHELLVLLDAANNLDVDPEVARRLASTTAEVREMTDLDPDSLQAVDAQGVKRHCYQVLETVSLGARDRISFHQRSKETK